MPELCNRPRFSSMGKLCDMIQTHSFSVTTLQTRKVLRHHGATMWTGPTQLPMRKRLCLMLAQCPLWSINRWVCRLAKFDRNGCDKLYQWPTEPKHSKADKEWSISASNR